MKKNILMGLALSIALAGAAAAQKPAHRGDGLLLKGIELTEGQRTQVAQLRKTQRDAMESRRKQGKTEFEAMREARQRGDTAAVRAQMSKLQQARELERTQHVAAVRNLLTAEQRVQFDKNVTELKAREAERAEKLAQRGAKGGKRGHRGR
jgi:Spy/CpxP family protein refolding chaperone